MKETRFPIVFIVSVTSMWLIVIIGIKACDEPTPPSRENTTAFITRMRSYDSSNVAKQEEFILTGGYAREHARDNKRVSSSYGVLLDSFRQSVGLPPITNPDVFRIWREQGVNIKEFDPADSMSHPRAFGAELDSFRQSVGLPTIIHIEADSARRTWTK